MSIEKLLCNKCAKEIREGETLKTCMINIISMSVDKLKCIDEPEQFIRCSKDIAYIYDAICRN